MLGFGFQFADGDSSFIEILKAEILNTVFFNCF